MNLEQWQSPLPKPWLNVNVNSLTAQVLDVTSVTVDTFSAMSADVDDVKSERLLLDQNVVVGVPPAGFSLVYADNTDRLNVASQTQPTRQLAYLTDVPIVTPDQIVSPDSLTVARCSDGLFNVAVNGDDRIIADANDTILRSKTFPASGGSGLKLSDTGDIELASYNGLLGSFNLFTADPKINITAPGGTGQIDMFKDYITIRNDNGGGAPILREIITTTEQTFYSPDTREHVKIDNTGVKVDRSYYLPNSAGTIGQVITNDGAGSSSWQSIPILLPSWVNSYYDPAPLGTFTNVILGAINAFSEVGTVLTLQQSGVLFDSPAAGRLRYIGIAPITCSVNYSVSMDSSANNQNMISRLYKSGVALAGSTCWCFTSTGLNVLNSSVSFTISLTSGQYLSIFIANNSSAVTTASVLTTNISLNIL